MLKAFSKKTLSLLLALCLIAGSSLAAFAADPSVVATVEADGNKIVAMETTDVMSGLRLPWVCMLNGPVQDCNVDLYLASVDETSRLELFSPNLIPNGTVHHNNNAYAVIGGTVYTSYNETAGGPANTRTETVMLKEDETPLVLSPKTWYSFSYQFNVITGAYTATVTERDTATVLATQTGERPETRAELPSANATALITLIAAQNFSGKILIDNVDIFAKKEDGTVAGTASYSGKAYNFDNCAIGSSFTTSGLLAGAGTPSANIDTEENYLLFGKTESLTPPSIKLIFSNVAEANIINDNIKLLENGAPVALENYSVAVSGTEAILSFLAPLKYETEYQIDVSELGITKGISFVTLDDEFVATGSEFLNSADAPIYGMPAAGNTLKASVSFENGDIETRKYLVLLVIYDGDKMVAATSAQGMIDAGLSGVPVETPAITVPAGENLTAQILVWNDWQGSYAMSAANVLE